MTDMTHTSPSFLRSLWPDHRTVWRWHFFAGLFCLPFVAFLSLTGSIYLFRPQIDDLIDRPYDHLPAVTAPSPSQDVSAALSAVPHSTFLAYELPRTPQSAARVIVDHNGDAIRVYVDRTTHHVLKTVSEELRFERVIFKLHGQLLLGNAGSVIMEMVASWTIILVITGLCLWWPRGQHSLAGILYPRLSLTGRARWRDFHAVTGVWISLFLVLFLVSGLPWSFVWGHALSSVEHTVGRLTSVQDWEIGAVPARDTIAGHPAPGPSVPDMPQTGTAGMNMTEMDMPRMDMPRMDMPGMDMPPAAPSAPSGPDLTGLDNVVRTAQTLSLPDPVLVTPPLEPDTPWTVRSDTQNRPLRESAQVTADGHIVSRRNFGQKGLVDRFTGYGVAAHEGQLFGPANQVINLLVALGLMLMSVAATILWLRQKPAGQTGAPPRLPSQRAGLIATAILCLLGLLLPELGASLIVLAVATRLGRHREQTVARKNG
ncbi:PepSY domain-containing protein [Acetobacter musti]|uniref:PepSY domain-containing protein n=2 Tax=Acetobacter musti TaxID=864732 RepID=A0ABX0JPS6_9PROT|nr:PepSY domain-containing protein [Acetobacter musti]